MNDVYDCFIVVGVEPCDSTGRMLAKTIQKETGAPPQSSLMGSQEQRGPQKVQENHGGSGTAAGDGVPGLRALSPAVCRQSLSKTDASGQRRSGISDSRCSAALVYGPESRLLWLFSQSDFPPGHLGFSRLCNRHERMDKISFSLYNHPLREAFPCYRRGSRLTEVEDLSQLHD